MDRTIFQVILFLGIVTLFTSPLTVSYLSEADAIKAEGKPAWRYGSATEGIVCGDRLCNEIVYKYVEPQNQKKLPSPLNQFKLGTPLNLIQCKPSFELVLKMVNNYPACVKPESVERLISINWALDKFEQNKIFSNLPTKSKSVTNFKEVDTVSNNPILNITPDYIDSQRQLIFKGSGWKGFHIVTIHITNDQGYFYELKTKTAQSGELFMPWFVPQDLSSGMYHFYAFVGDQTFEVDIPITQ